LGIAEYGDPANRENTMKTTIKYIAPWLAAAAIGGAIGLAPVASAAPGSTPVSAMAGDPGQSCTDISGAATECSSPGNVQINDSPPAVADPGFGSGFYGGPYPVPFDEGSR
jgi:hypothetical protein